MLDRDELDQLDMADHGGAHAVMLTDARPRALEDDMASVAIPPFEHFYEQHRAEVLRLLRRRVGAQRAEDAFQETFLRALQAYRRLEHGDHLRAWVLTIAGNVAVDTLRRARPQTELVEAGAEDDRPAYEELAPLTDGLAPKERAAVVLRYGYDLSYDQIAAALGSSEQAARQAASTGVRRLRRRSYMTVSPDLDRRFRDAAVTMGLVDMGFDVVDSPVGPLFVAASDQGLASISFDADPDDQLERLARIAGPRVLRSARSVDEARRELDQYFEGKRRAFDLSLDLRALPPFTLSVLQELARVPYGETTTYGELAARVGRPRAARAVGTVMNRNRIPIVLPCHRVVGAGGNLVGYAGGLDTKIALLQLEGALL